MHEASSFITLTYDNEHVPKDGSLNVRDFQLFMKKLRRGSSVPLRFFHCGEYGDENLRPHFHACLFGEDFLADRVFLKNNPRGEPLYGSRRLYEAWGKGAFEQQTIGALTFESAAYVARYCLKKVTGPRAVSHYGDRKPEYVTMSRRPGIGSAWMLRFGAETYASDSVVMRGREMMPPPFYDKLLQKTDPFLFESIKDERERQGRFQKASPDRTYERLRVREEVKEQTIKNALKRK